MYSCRIRNSKSTSSWWQRRSFSSTPPRCFRAILKVPHHASLSSTTGYVSADFDQWPSFAKFILLLIIIAGGCGGSTAGGLKVMRLILLFKCFSAILKLHMHPRAVFHMTVGKEKFSRNTVL